MPKPIHVAQAQSFDGKVSWEITIPKINFRPQDKRKISFPIQFHVQNNSEIELLTSIQIHSLSRVLRFQSVVILIVGKTRIKEESKTLTGALQHKIPPKRKGTFKFQAIYYPYLSHKPIPNLNFEYIISAFDKTGKVTMHSDPYKVQIPRQKSEFQSYKK